MSATEDRAGEIAVRTDNGASLVRAIPVPRELQELGVRFGADESGTRVVYLPESLKTRVNIIAPITSYAQADPNWTPAISLVKLSEGEPLTYGLPGGKLGLSKQALETLGRAAGVLYTRTSRVPRDELNEGELWAYRATVGFRRSDGTVDEVTRERGFNREAEQMEIEDSVTNARDRKFGQPGSDTWKAEVRKRWIAELRHGPAKTESKAVNRALRAGLGMPASVTKQQLAKPFLVIGFNFTPDYSDPEIKRALVAVGLNASAAIYGGRDASTDLPQHGAADIPAIAAAAEGEPAVGGEQVEPVADAGSQTDGAAADAGEPELGAEPDLDDESESAEDVPLEPEPQPKPRGGIRIPEAAINAAGAVVATSGGRTVAQVCELAEAGDAQGLEWLSWARQALPEDDEKRQALELYASQRIPEIWANV